MEQARTVSEVYREELTNHEKFMRGEPLTQELAEIKEGKAAPEPERAPPPPRAPLEDIERELLRSERAALRELRQSPGWPVLMRLQKKAFHAAKKGATTFSQMDPLGNQQKIAEHWAYVTLLEASHKQLERMVEAELKIEDKL